MLTVTGATRLSSQPSPQPSSPQSWLLTGTPAAATVPPGRRSPGVATVRPDRKRPRGPPAAPGPVAGGFTTSPTCTVAGSTSSSCGPTARCGHGAATRKGQLGPGGTANAASPVRVAGVPSVVAVTTGHYHSMALAADGHVWAWGWNASGQLGGRNDHHPPIAGAVNGIDHVVLIAAGADMSYAVRADGTAWAWGKNDLGQLGDGTLVGRRARCASPASPPSRRSPAAGTTVWP